MAGRSATFGDRHFNRISVKPPGISGGNAAIEAAGTPARRRSANRVSVSIIFASTRSSPKGRVPVSNSHSITASE